MKYSQSTFSFLLPLTDEEIFEQIEYCQQKGWAVSVEHTSNPDPRNHFWERWGIPLLDRGDPKLIMIEIQQCRRAYPKHYIKVTGFNMGSGKTSIEISFFVYRPQA